MPGIHRERPVPRRSRGPRRASDRSRGRHLASPGPVELLPAHHRRRAHRGQHRHGVRGAPAPAGVRQRRRRSYQGGDLDPGPLRPCRGHRLLPRGGDRGHRPGELRLLACGQRAARGLPVRNAAFAWIDAILAAMAHAESLGDGPTPRPSPNRPRPSPSDSTSRSGGGSSCSFRAGRRDHRRAGDLASRLRTRSPGICSAPCSAMFPTSSPCAATVIATLSAYVDSLDLVLGLGPERLLPGTSPRSRERTASPRRSPRYAMPHSGSMTGRWTG